VDCWRCDADRWRFWRWPGSVCPEDTKGSP